MIFFKCVPSLVKFGSALNLAGSATLKAIQCFIAHLRVALRPLYHTRSRSSSLLDQAASELFYSGLKLWPQSWDADWSPAGALYPQHNSILMHQELFISTQIYNPGDSAFLRKYLQTVSRDLLHNFSSKIDSLIVLSRFLEELRNKKMLKHSDCILQHGCFNSKFIF